MLEKIFKSDSKNTLKPLVLVICDGWGVAPISDGNAIEKARPSFYKNTMLSRFPNSLLIASGESVGLPANIVGTSEVGHLTIGVGRVIDESLVRINRAIVEKKLYQNMAINEAMSRSVSKGSKLHILGLLSSGSVHSSVNHLYALIDMALSMRVKNVVLHLFTDGRDAPPNDGKQVFMALREKIAQLSTVKLGSISGRYWAMDRDARWERIQRVYDTLTGGDPGVKTLDNLYEHIPQSYQNGQTDEFIEPARSNDPSVVVSDGDSLLFFNFRADRARELVMPFVVPNFESLNSIEWGFDIDQGNTKARISKGPTFTRKVILKDIYVTTMTQYQKQLPVDSVAFPPPTITSTMADCFAQSNLAQLHLAESEKERMVSYYFNGLRADRLPLEELRVVASPKVSTYDKKPGMSALKIASEFKKELNKNKYSFFIINFANPDMVAHTGNLEATIKAIKVTDKALSIIWNEVRKVDGIMAMTADHGNAEELVTFRVRSYYFTSEGGVTNTEHSNNPVPFVIMKNEFMDNKSYILLNGALSDVAPTLLSLLGMQVPKEMTGKNLLTKK